MPPGTTSGAYTSGPLAWTEQHSLVTLTIVETNGVANSQCRAIITAAQFTCRFDPNGSYAVQGSRTNALLAHENLHMTIGEFIATRATANRPSMLGKGGGQSTDIAQAKLNAKTVADRDIINQMTAYGLKWIDVNESASRSYDNGTALPGQGGGSNPQAQADWQANWQVKVQQILVNSGWN